jgi:hypothetical protein
MYRIHYAGDSLLTGTEIARALLDYASALARASSSATVSVPTRLADGSTGRSEILIGPASQLVSDAEPSEFEEVVDDDLVRRFRAEIRKLRPQQAGVMTEPEVDAARRAAPNWVDDI